MLARVVVSKNYHLIYQYQKSGMPNLHHRYCSTEITAVPSDSEGVKCVQMLSCAEGEMLCSQEVSLVSCLRGLNDLRCRNVVAAQIDGACKLGCMRTLLTAKFHFCKTNVVYMRAVMVWTDAPTVLSECESFRLLLGWRRPCALLSQLQGTYLLGCRAIGEEARA